MSTHPSEIIARVCGRVAMIRQPYPDPWTLVLEPPQCYWLHDCEIQAENSEIAESLYEHRALRKCQEAEMDVGLWYDPSTKLWYAETEGPRADWLGATPLAALAAFIESNAERFKKETPK